MFSMKIFPLTLYHEFQFSEMYHILCLFFFLLCSKYSSHHWRKKTQFEMNTFHSMNSHRIYFLACISVCVVSLFCLCSVRQPLLSISSFTSLFMFGIDSITMLVRKSAYNFVVQWFRNECVDKSRILSVTTERHTSPLK